MRVLLRSAALLLLSALASGAQAQMYKCTSPQGKVFFQGFPCPGDAKQTQTQQPPSGGAPAPAAKAAAKADAKASRDAVKAWKPGPIKPWSKDELNDFHDNCPREMAHEKLRDHTMKTGARMPPETRQQWEEEMEKPCACMQKKAVTRWHYEQYALNRANYNLMLLRQSPECLRPPEDAKRR